MVEERGEETERRRQPRPTLTTAMRGPSGTGHSSTRPRRGACISSANSDRCDDMGEPDDDRSSAVFAVVDIDVVVDAGVADGV